MEASGGPGGFCRLVEAPETLLKRLALEASGGAWLEAPGGPWKPLEAPGGPWRVLEAPGRPPAAGLTKYYQCKKAVIKLVLHFSLNTSMA